MNIIESFVKNNRCYKNNQKITIKGLMLHSVGCPQPDPKVLIGTWNSEKAEVCVHAITGREGIAYQLLPWNVRAWHCGSGGKGSGNDGYIGVEMTEPATIKYIKGASFMDRDPEATKAFVLDTYKSAVDIFAYLCKLHGLNPEKDGVIISHSEGHKRGIASNHGDVEHIWSKYGLTMDMFRKDVANALHGVKGPGDTNTPPQTGNTVNGANTQPYTVKVMADVLNVRKGPGVSYPVTTEVKRGEVYTIVAEEMNGTTVWGKLKSGAGYISLAYTRKN